MISTRTFLANTWLATAMLCVAAPSAQAQSQESDVVPPALRTDIEKNAEQLQKILQERGISEKRSAELTAEVEAIRKDKATITAALIQSAKTEKKLSADIFQLNEDLTALEAQQDDIRDSLWERRGALAEVLAGLQRMGLNPPPALLVKPEDALSSVRSSILLSAVVPHMRAQTEILVADIKELGQVTASMKSESAKLDQTRAEQADERARLTLLVEEKKKLEGQTTEKLAAEQKRMQDLIAKAESLEGFIGSLEDEAKRIQEEAEAKRIQEEAEAKRRAEEQARLDEERRVKEAAEAARLAEEKARLDAERAKTEADEKKRLAAEKVLAEAEAKREEADRQETEAAKAIAAARKRAEQLAEAPRRFAPAKPFSARGGQLAKPVAGRTITAFGADDGFGATAKGDTIETSPNAIVTAPADGKVLYAGPFRAYGNLLILDTGENYHLVLAGMDTIDVAQGQFVLEGEPIGAMGRIKLASVTAAATDKDNPTLYVEFRKNSKPIDPSPWWERVSAGRT